MKEISDELYDKLNYLGLIPNDVRSHNVGKSNYSNKTIQPWSIWLDYPELTGWDDDIIKRVLRTKEECGMSEIEARIMDYEKMIHNCKERIRQLKLIGNQNTIEEKTIEYKKGDILRCVKSWNYDDGFAMVEGFTRGFNYQIDKDFCLTTNQGATMKPTKEFLDEHFKKI